MDCENSLKCLFKSQKADFLCDVDEIKLKCILKVKTCCGVSDYFVLQENDKYLLYDLYNKYIPTYIMIEVKKDNNIYYKKIENNPVEDINEFKNIYPIVEIVDLEKVEGLEFEKFLEIIKNRE